MRNTTFSNLLVTTNVKDVNFVAIIWTFPCNEVHKPDSCPEVKLTLLGLPSSRKEEVHNFLDTIVWG